MLTTRQISELSTDVYDELVRRSEEKVSSLPSRSDISLKRNQARLKLAKLTNTWFQHLANDVYHELLRRYPEFKQASPFSRLIPGSMHGEAKPYEDDYGWVMDPAYSEIIPDPLTGEEDTSTEYVDQMRQYSYEVRIAAMRILIADLQQNLRYIAGKKEESEARVEQLEQELTLRSVESSLLADFKQLSKAKDPWKSDAENRVLKVEDTSLTQMLNLYVQEDMLPADGEVEPFREATASNTDHAPLMAPLRPLRPHPTPPLTSAEESTSEGNQPISSDGVLKDVQVMAFSQSIRNLLNAGTFGIPLQTLEALQTVMLVVATIKEDLELCDKPLDRSDSQELSALRQRAEDMMDTLASGCAAQASTEPLFPRLLQMAAGQFSTTIAEIGQKFGIRKATRAEQEALAMQLGFRSSLQNQDAEINNSSTRSSTYSLASSRTQTTDYGHFARRWAISQELAWSVTSGD